jgi:hypothetical protein
MGAHPVRVVAAILIVGTAGLGYELAAGAVLERAKAGADTTSPTATNNVSTSTASTSTAPATNTTPTTPAQTGPPAAVLSKPGQLALRPEDLPQGLGAWRKVLRAVLNNQAAARLAGVTTADVENAGRVTGYFEVFVEKLRRIAGPTIDATTGKVKSVRSHVFLGCCVDQVSIMIDVFDSDAAAMSTFRNVRSGTYWQLVHVPANVGDAAKIYKGWLTPPYRIEGAKEPAYRLSWLSGPVIVTLNIGGVAPSSKDVLTLGGTEDAHIRAVLAGTG